MSNTVAIIRSTVTHGGRWSATCSHCPLWEISRQPYMSFRRLRRDHTIQHQNEGHKVST